MEKGCLDLKHPAELCRGNIVRIVFVCSMDVRVWTVFIKVFMLVFMGSVSNPKRLAKKSAELSGLPMLHFPHVGCEGMGAYWFVQTKCYKFGERWCKGDGKKGTLK